MRVSKEGRKASWTIGVNSGVELDLGHSCRVILFPFVSYWGEDPAFYVIKRKKIHFKK